MNEFITTLLQAVIVAAVPVCTAAIGKGIWALVKYIGAKTNNELAKKYLNEAASAISTAVTYTSQTYVDSLRGKGEFDRESQKQALATAVEKAKSLLTAEATAFIEEAYGDLTDYLKTNIEAEVRNQKSGALWGATLQI